ncbi:MAG: hypothetical protein U0992_06215 [Planctomycetaceae bacterium]
MDSASAQGRRRGGEPPAAAKAVKVGEFGAEVAHKYTTKDGLPSDNIQSIVVSPSGRILAGTDHGLGVLDGDKWQQLSDYAGSLPAMGIDGAGIIAITDNGLFRAEQGQVDQLADLPQSGGKPAAATCIAGGSRRLVGTEAGLFELSGGSLKPVDDLNSLLGGHLAIRQIAVASDGRVAVAAEAGLYLQPSGGAWQQVLASGGGRSWAPHNVRGVAFDSKGRLAFCEPQGIGIQDGDAWKLYTAADGLPYADFTSAAARPDGGFVFGTHERDPLRRHDVGISPGPAAAAEQRYSLRRRRERWPRMVRHRRRRRLHRTSADDAREEGEVP